MMAWNGSGNNYGDCFFNNGQPGLGTAISVLSEHGEAKATRTLRDLSSDGQASTRRVNIALCTGDDELIREEVKAALQTSTAAWAVEAAARTKAHWQAQRCAA